MSDILLAKPHLPPDWIDVSVGEPHVVREALFQCFDMKDWKLPVMDHCWEYPNPQGYRPLVDLLEHKHNGHKVVITNGAKQALGATFYALKKMGYPGFSMKQPYWALIPPLAEMHGLISATVVGNIQLSSENNLPFLLLAPNNPNGECDEADELVRLSREYQSKNTPFIHDAAYYTYSYLPRSRSLPIVGDVQIHSLSKMLGLSNLRIGYAVCPNLEFHRLIKEYVETMTVGASLPSQLFAYDILNQMRGYPTIVEKFENISFAALVESKKIFQQVNPEILEVPSNLTEVPGMFGWFKVGAKADFQRSKINIIDGALFGVPGYVRMNLAFPADKVQEIVTRLNSVLS